MVGIGTFEEAEEGKEGNQGKHGEGGSVYVVRQVFMDNPGQERALLSFVGDVLARCTGLVSFNGRAFDAPLLENRYLLNREPSPLRGLLHFDLLPAARQRWRLRLPSRSLGSLERDILAFERSEEDVPGWLIPSIYQQYAAWRRRADAAGAGGRGARLLSQPARHRQHGAAGRHPLRTVPEWRAAGGPLASRSMSFRWPAVSRSWTGASTARRPTGERWSCHCRTKFVPKR